MDQCNVYIRPGLHNYPILTTSFSRWHRVRNFRMFRDIILASYPDSGPSHD